MSGQPVCSRQRKKTEMAQKQEAKLVWRNGLISHCGWSLRSRREESGETLLERSDKRS